MLSGAFIIGREGGRKEGREGLKSWKYLIGKYFYVRNTQNIACEYNI